MEEMNYVFGVATPRHVLYQVKVVAPWCVDHYIRRQRGVDCPPLYRWDRREKKEREDTNEDDGGDSHELTERNSSAVDADTEIVARTTTTGAANE